MKNLLQVHLLLFLANLIYAGNFTIAKLIMPEPVGPYGFIFLRVSCALVLFALLYASWVREKVEKKDWIRMAICGLFGVAINQLMFFGGLAITTPINGAIMMITAPILVMIISAIVLGEKLTIAKGVGIVLGFVGAFIAMGGQDFSFSSQTALGDAFILINAASYAIYLVLVKPLMVKYHPVTVITWVFFFGFFPVSIAGYAQFAAIPWADFGAREWWCAAYVVIGTTFFAYLFNIFALRKAQPSVVGVYIFLQPVLTSLIAVLAGSDTITWIKVVSASLIFLGVYFVSMYKPKKAIAKAA